MKTFSLQQLDGVNARAHFVLQEKQYSFEMVKDLASKGLTVFRMADIDLPDMESSRQARQRAQELIREVRASL